MTDHHGNDTDLSHVAQIPLEASEWLAYGIGRGWCSVSFCATHDAYAILTPEETQEWEAGHDPYMFVVRLLEP